ncbi:MAG TPA: hypothetical protein VFE47_06680 [Tepidisphaeraceae bacterium]|nr:hypothetical protein [Tepidisphaeraceae bacterium]
MLIGLGLLFALAAAFSFVIREPIEQELQTTDWYTYRSTPAVMQDLKTGTGKPVPDYTTRFHGMQGWHGWIREEFDLARLALDELLAREKAGRLSPSERDEIFDQGIAAEWAKDETPVQYYLLDYVASRAGSGDVTPEQLEQFYRPAFSPQFRARARVLEGDKVPVEFTRMTWLRGHQRWSQECKFIHAAVDGKDVEFRSQPGNDFLDFREMRLLPSAPLGVHTVTLDVRISVSGENAARVMDLHLSAPFEVVARTPANFVRLSHPVATAQMTAWAKSPGVCYLPMGHDACFSVCIWNTTPTQPADAAFDVFAKYGGQEHLIGQWAALAGPDRSMGSIPFTPLLGVPKPPPIVDIIFRPSRVVAANTVDLTDIWDKAIVVKSVTMSFAR